MVELKEKTVEELRKMASKKKIEGRSKMNKAQLVRALQKKSLPKKRKMKGGVVIDGVDYNPDRFNFIFRLLLTPSTNNTQHPRVYMIPIVNNLFNMTTIDEILQIPYYLIININANDFLRLRRNTFEIIHSLSNPPEYISRGIIRSMRLEISRFNINENVFFIQDNHGNYRIFDLSICRNEYGQDFAGYQAKLAQLGLGDEQRLFPINQAHQPGQA